MIFEELVQKSLSKLNEEPLENTVKTIIESEYHSEIPALNSWTEKIKREIEGWGPIEEFLSQEGISEICINSYDQIFAEQGGILAATAVRFASPLTYDRFVKRLLHKMDKVGDRRIPLVDGMLDDHTRVHIALPPISTSPRVSIRRHRAKSWSLNDLYKFKMLDQKLLENIRQWITDKKNILVAGPTGSGKTTLLRALMMECESTERLISLEDRGELGSVGAHHVNLLTRMEGEDLVPTIDLSLLIKNVLRMRPDRIIIGEVRGEEAALLLDALATGHRGSMSTLHGSSCAHALKRLESLVSRACPKWDPLAIRQLIFDSLDVVIFCDKKNGLRKISQTALISGIESFGYLLDSRDY